jgi:L-fucose mutarotase/ribose pyranase (RbsD/FucU family)
MTGGPGPVYDLERRLAELKAVVDLNDQRVSQHITAMQEDIEEIKESEKDYVQKENFAFYEKAFWIVTTSTVTTLIGAVAWVVSGRGG